MRFDRVLSQYNRKIMILGILLIGLMVAPLSQQPVFSRGKELVFPEGSQFREGEVMVRLSDRNRSTLQSLQASLGGADVGREFGFLSDSRGRTYVLLCSSGKSTLEMLDLLSADSRVEAACPNFIRRKTEIPNDAKWERQWNMRKVSAPEAWDITAGDPSVIVGVIDTGVDYTNEDLKQNMWRNPGEIPGNHVDDDGNGYIDDFYGFNFAADEPANGWDPMDTDDHGSHVSGIISARGNNGIGISGTGWYTGIMALKATRNDGLFYDSDAIEAVQYAVKMKRDYGVNIVALNASWGGPGYNPLMKDAIDEADRQGIVFVAAAGNGGDDDTGDNLDEKPFYPASYPSTNILSVAASDENDSLASFSNYGLTQVDLAAPGVNIFSTYRRLHGQETEVRLGLETISSYSLEYSGNTPPGGLILPVIDCGMGNSSIDYPAQVAGNIALIERGELTFKEKVQLAQAAGAVAAVIFNNETGIFSGTLGEPGEWIPVVSVSREDGHKIQSALPTMLTLVNSFSDYGYMEGTSQASPHVAGAVAILAADQPGESHKLRMARLLAGCDYPAGLEGKVRTGGRLNIHKSLQMEVSVLLYAVRKEGAGWMVKRDAGFLQVNLDPDSDLQQMRTCRFEIRKKIMNGGFLPVKEFGYSDFINGSYVWYDNYLDNDKYYSYQVIVRDSQGTIVGSSNRLTL